MKRLEEELEKKLDAYDKFPEEVKAVLHREGIFFSRPSENKAKSYEGWKRYSEIIRIVRELDIDPETESKVKDYVCWALGK